MGWRRPRALVPYTGVTNVPTIHAALVRGRGALFANLPRRFRWAA